MEKNNESAFPKQGVMGQGLTKREYAAIKIMAGYAGSSVQNLAGVGMTVRAQWAVAEADALLEELAK